MSVSDVISRVQILWEDKTGEQVDKDYVQDFLAIHSEDVESRLETLDLSYDTVVVVLAGTLAAVVAVWGVR